MKVHMVSVTRLMDSYLAEVAHGSLGVLCQKKWHKIPREPCATSAKYESISLVTDTIWTFIGPFLLMLKYTFTYLEFTRTRKKSHG